MAIDQDIADLTATELRRLIGVGELSPVDVVEASLSRIQRYNEAVNAIVTLNERALDEANALERTARIGETRPLHGLPVGIKDVTPVKGVRTTFGSPLYANHVPTEDAEVVRRLRQAGAVIIGKTNCPEFAAGGNTFNDVFGRTRNPWDLSRSAGGSTGGGAAGVATGMIALAEGTDLGGSLRIPASFCGLVGLRPSAGLVPTYPHDYLWDTLQVTGFIARAAEDVALTLQAVAGPSGLTPVSQPAKGRDFVGTVLRGIDTNVRIAYCPDTVGIGIDDDIERVCRSAAQDFTQAGASVDAIDIDLAFGRQAFLALRGLWFVSLLHDRLDKIDQFGPNVAANVRAGLDTTTEELGAAEQARGKIREVFRCLFETYDYLVTPCMAVPPFPVEENYPATVAGKPMNTYIDWVAPTFVLSLTGLPVASVPCGLDKSGLPVGLQIVGKPFGEEAVLVAAKAMQEINPIGRPNLSI